jgi:hypothetical protein
MNEGKIFLLTNIDLFCYFHGERVLTRYMRGAPDGALRKGLFKAYFFSADCFENDDQSQLENKR